MNTYTIREMSQRFDVPSSTLRYYEDLGILPVVERDEKKQRIYTDEHVDRLYAISCFKRTGLPMAKIHDFFEYAEDLNKNIDKVCIMMSEHEQNIISQMEKMQQDLEHIQQKVRFYNGIKKAIEEDKPWPRFEDYSL
ncbi:MAG: MerR family transcriptional regulator [Eubacterium sp.]|nr:MerR family transcriptional regulator [Eubacterium sp.]